MNTCKNEVENLNSEDLYKEVSIIHSFKGVKKLLDRLHVCLHSKGGK